MHQIEKNSSSRIETEMPNVVGKIAREATEERSEEYWQSKCDHGSHGWKPRYHFATPSQKDRMFNKNQDSVPLSHTKSINKEKWRYRLCQKSQKMLPAVMEFVYYVPFHQSWCLFSLPVFLIIHNKWACSCFFNLFWCLLQLCE